MSKTLLITLTHPITVSYWNGCALKLPLNSRVLLRGAQSGESASLPCPCCFIASADGTDCRGVELKTVQGFKPLVFKNLDTASDGAGVL